MVSNSLVCVGVSRCTHTQLSYNSWRSPKLQEPSQFFYRDAKSEILNERIPVAGFLSGVGQVTVTNEREVSLLPKFFAPMPARDKEGNEAYYFITLVKLAPGKAPQDFMKVVDGADLLLQKAGMRTRHQRGIHEDRTFVTLGRHDLVVIWRAPDLKSVSQYLHDLLEVRGSDLGTTETLVVTAQGID